MGTQAIISIVKAGKVQAKIVTGSNGYNVPRLAAHLRETQETDPQKLLALCAEFDLCHCCTMVQTADAISPDPDGLDDVAMARWKRTFDDPRFNPRWEQGTASFTEIVELKL